MRLTLCASTYLDLYQEYTLTKNKKLQNHY